MSCSLVSAASTGPSSSAPLGQALTGNTVSSLHRLKDLENREGAYFVFADLSVKLEGAFKLEFNLFEMREDGCVHITSITSAQFTVFAKRNFPGMMESTPLTRTFADQGVRLRLRKEPRALLRKRGPASDDYEPRHYKTSKKKGDDQESQSSSSYSQSIEGTASQQPYAHTYNLNQPASMAGNYPHLQHLAYNPQQGSMEAQQQVLAGALQGARMYADPQAAGYAAQMGAQAYGFSHYPATPQQRSRQYAHLQAYPNPQYGTEVPMHPGYHPAMVGPLPMYSTPGAQAYPVGPPRYDIGHPAAEDPMLISPINPTFDPGTGPLAGSAEGSGRSTPYTYAPGSSDRSQGDMKGKGRAPAGSDYNYPS